MGKARQDRHAVIGHILAEVASGRPVSSVLAEDDGMPSKSEFWRWHMDDEVLRGNLADARANGVEALMEDARRIAATPMMGEIVTEKPVCVEGKPVPGVTIREVKTEDMLGHRKLLIDTIHKQAQMLKPKTYGAKVDVTSGGEPIGEVDETTRAIRIASVLNSIGKDSGADHAS